MATMEAAEGANSLEEGELDAETPENGEPAVSADKRPAVPEPPPSPPKLVQDWQMTSGNKKQQKKSIQKAQKAGQVVGPALYRAVYGAQAQAEVIFKPLLQFIRVSDIQALVLWLLTDFQEGRAPNWALVKNVPLVRQVVLLYVPGVSQKLFEERQDLFPNLRKLGKPVKVLAKDPLIRAGYPVALLLNAPYAREKKQYMRQAADGLDGGKEAPAQPPFPPSHYVLKPDMMSKMGYPLPDTLAGGKLQPPEGFVMTQPRASQERYSAVFVRRLGCCAEGEESSGQEELLALDCEMCETLQGRFELTRVSLVDENKQVMYDELVLPFNSITNYHTNKSGITAETLQGVTTRLQDVQKRFLELVPANSILVGHALENDLKALKVVHMRCIDTGALFPHPKGLPFRSALRRIAERFLKRQIQTGSHDPIIDATTALDLAKLKMRHGPAYGLVTQQIVGEPMAEVLMRAKQGCVLVDKVDTLNKYLSGCADGIPCASDEEVVEKLTKEVQKEPGAGTRAKFVWGQLRSLSNFQEAQANHARKAAEGNGPSCEESQLAACTLDSQNGTALRPQHLIPQKRSSLEVPQEEVGPSKRQRSEGAADVSQAEEGGAESSDDKQSSKAQQCSEAGHNGDAVGNGSASGEEKSAREMEEGEQEATVEEKLMHQLDEHVGRVFDAVLPDSIFIVATCHGNTPNARLLHEWKLRRTQGLMQPPWTEKEEEHFVKDVADVEQKGLCFVTAKRCS